MDRLRTALGGLPPETLVPARWVLEQLDGAPAPAPEPRDLTIEDVAAQFGRRPSTIRGWCERGLLRGYRLNGKAWRFPAAAVDEFRAAQQAPRRSRSSADLGSWRRQKAGGC